MNLAVTKILMNQNFYDWNMILVKALSSAIVHPIRRTLQFETYAKKITEAGQSRINESPVFHEPDVSSGNFIIISLVLIMCLLD